MNLFKRLYFVGLNILLIITLILIVRSQKLANDFGKLYIEQGKLVNSKIELINEQINLITNTNNEQQRTNLRLDRIGLEASGIRLSIQKADLVISQLNANLRMIPLFLITLLVALFWILSVRYL